MIGDKVNTKEKHTRAAAAILEQIGEHIGDGATFTVAGQSGAGKSEVAHELARLLDEAGRKTIVFQQDDYFFFPPKTNHNRRVEDIEWVGAQEVNLALLDEHMAAFKSSANRVLEKPLVIFEEDRVISENVDLTPFKAMVAEGTYTTLLQNADWRIFIDRDYHDTFEDRKERGREKLDDFSEKVMMIEDAIISRHKARANIIIKKNFSIEMVEKESD